MPEKELRELLGKLAQNVILAIKDGLTNGTVHNRYVPYIRWKVNEFEYTDTGFKNLSRSGEQFSKPLWDTQIVFQDVIKLDIYNDTHKAISEHYHLDEGRSNDYLHRLITKLATEYLADETKPVADLTKHIEIFLEDLDGKKHECRAEVRLRGLILAPDVIQLDENTKLRKPQPEDLEGEYFYGLYSVQSQEDLTAILDTKAYIAKDDAIPLQNEIDKEIAILRLFRVGAIKYVSYSMEIDSVLNMFNGSIGGGGYALVGPDKYLIKEEDIEPLKTFWSNLKKVELPASALPNSVGEIDMVSIAFERYSDSLDSRVFEKRISSAVMGLEALYLSGGAELSYTLQMRVGKMLSLIGYDSNEVQKAIKDAYKIRSTYVHGGVISEKDREKIERTCGNINEFSRLIMDYLRASIVAWLIRPNKSSLIKKIDESLLDAKKEAEIKKLLFKPI